jgi:hypothetical protein
MRRIPSGTLVSVAAPVVVAIVALLLGAMMARTAPDAAPAHWLPSFSCYDAPLVAVGGSSMAGAAVLCISDGNMRPSLTARGLPPVRAFSVLLQHADPPTTCRSDPCADDELLTPDRSVLMGRLGGGLTDRDGTAQFLGRPRPLPLTSGPQVTLLLVSHRAAEDEIGEVTAYASFRLP